MGHEPISETPKVPPSARATPGILERFARGGVGIVETARQGFLSGSGIGVIPDGEVVTAVNLEIESEREPLAM